MGRRSLSSSLSQESHVVTKEPTVADETDLADGLRQLKKMREDEEILVEHRKLQEDEVRKMFKC